MDTDSNAWLRVDLDAIRQNTAQAANGTQLIPVLKADAYGLGMAPVAKALEPLEQVCCFAVAQVGEGLTLREDGIRRDLLILGEALPQQISAAVQAELTLTVGRAEDLSIIAAAARTQKTRARIQIKFDTGLHRIGVEPESVPALLSALRDTADALLLTGAYSHFADPTDEDRCAAQYRLFLSLCDQLAQAGFPVPLRHICDSAASERYPAYALDAVRIGRRLAWDAPDAPSGNIREATTLQAYVTDVRRRKTGDLLGYGTGVSLSRDSVIAGVGIGYGDGLDPRMAKRGLSVLLHGRLCPILYTFMDQTLIDVTDCPAAVGDVVTIFGFDGVGTLLSAQAQALACSANEGCGLTAALLPRVRRIYAGKV